jgi:hypothetical protein
MEALKYHIRLRETYIALLIFFRDILPKDVIKLIIGHLKNDTFWNHHDPKISKLIKYVMIGNAIIADNKEIKLVMEYLKNNTVLNIYHFIFNKDIKNAMIGKIMADNKEIVHIRNINKYYYVSPGGMKTINFFIIALISKIMEKSTIIMGHCRRCTHFPSDIQYVIELLFGETSKKFVKRGKQCVKKYKNVVLTKTKNNVQIKKIIGTYITPGNVKKIMQFFLHRYDRIGRYASIYLAGVINEIVKIIINESNDIYLENLLIIFKQNKYLKHLYFELFI